jgi:hypothetical protein
MKSALKVLILLATVAGVSAPTLAHADAYLSPFLGVNFGNNSGNGRMNVGADVGWMGAGIIGLEADFGYAPGFFGNKGTYGSNSVMDLMGNVILAAPIGGQHGVGIRPYVTVGGGLLRSKVDGPVGATAIVSDGAGLDAGAGIMGYMGEHFGLRGDVRYFRNLHDNSSANNLNIDFGAFHYWRAALAIVIRP